ncbi:putative C6 transcription factor [Aspergillus steynii IBT 23096]|uniref:Putative C6 transcription factor n=1 Tax=Aspergillus steynii IBT 23096 TaxID=1392250 RepID=A0A2I2G9X3_9EURO|nr:putative C6 transcription factor [Aspergillus steynii IBT 23096]PLB49679.1 putative C6 transcription factor [Aspergillus steynii IBT 23096]
MTSRSKRQRRSKIACEPCRIRKRKCDGSHPCGTCSEFEYRCYYDVDSRKKRNKNDYVSPTRLLETSQPDSTPEAPTPPAILPQQVPTAPTCLPAQILESNSGAAFARQLALKFDPVNAPEPQIFAWNIGSRQSSDRVAALPIIDIISQHEMEALADVYFEKVDPYYGFIDRNSCYEHLNSRWSHPSPFEPYDVVLCGVAAMGYLFSARKPLNAEHLLVESARSSLKRCCAFGIHSLATISGWTLRLSYLRLTGTPHVAWMSSCSLLHLMEAAGFHIGPSSKPLLIKPPQNIDHNIRRRLVGFALYINMWISFDLGRSRVILQGACYTPPISPEGDYTAEMLNLIPLSESLDPHKPVDSSQLKAMLSNILASQRSRPPSVLSQCNLVLTIFRRIRALNSNICGDFMAQVLALITRALACARELALHNSPWSHVANVPFQIVCTLLAMDSPESLALLDDAMETLKNVTDAYNTDMMKEAYRTAGLLILLQQKRKDHDSKHLSNLLGAHFSTASEPNPNGDGSDHLQPVHDSSYLDALLPDDLPSFGNFDFTQFFVADPSDSFGLDI